MAAADDFCWRFTGADHCLLFRYYGISYSGIRSVWSMLNYGRGTFSGVHGCGRRIWRICGSSHVQSFCQCREGIPFSPGIRKPKTSFCYLDGDGKWGLHFGNKGRKGKDYGNHHRKNCGLWSEGFHEYGSLYGACSL